jgi:2-oxoisovalerate dehydrogenase E1 component
MESHIIDGNNILEVYIKLNELVADVRENPRPVLLEFKTFRVRGHEEASGTKYVPNELLQTWDLKDPLLNYVAYLKTQGILTEEIEVASKASIMKEIQDGLDIAFAEPNIESTTTNELNDVFHQFEYKEIKENNEFNNLRLVDAISESLRQSMQRHDNLVLMGQDIADYGGVFKITDGFLEEFGKDRVRNTPICESAIVSAAMGLSINGYKAMMEMQFSDFVTSGFNPIVNLLAKSNYRWNQKADVVIRMPCGAGVGAGPFHSQTNEAWFTHTPGLKVVYPAFPYDAKGLLATCIEDPNPVLFFEHKALYRSIRQDVPTNYYTLPLGKASIINEGNDVSVITYGAGVHWALDSLKDLKHISVDLIDLRSLAPLDTEAIYNSVNKTGKVMILQEDSMFGGIASDIAAMIMENCFEKLDAPVKRLASLDTPIPFAANLEADYLPKSKFKNNLLELLAY